MPLNARPPLLPGSFNSLLTWKFASFFVHFFQKNYFRDTIRESNGLDPEIRTDVLSVLIRVQTVCKGYQQTIPVDKEFKVNVNMLYYRKP